MIAIDMCQECPRCHNHTLSKSERYKFFGAIYDVTNYTCLNTKCGWFINSKDRNLTWDNPRQIIRNEKLKELGIE
jgi:hypothetical protein